jgi:hypothetical protein
MKTVRKGMSWGNHTEEAKEKIRNHRHTDEFKKHLSETRKGKKIPIMERQLQKKPRLKFEKELKSPGKREGKEKKKGPKPFLIKRHVWRHTC